MSKLPAPRDRQRPIPLRPDPGAIRDNAMTSLTRSALAIALSAIELRARLPDEFVEKTWPHDRDAALLTRGVVFPANTADAVALTTASLAFLSSLTPLSAGADLLGRALSVQFGRVAEIHMPGLGLPITSLRLRKPPPSTYVCRAPLPMRCSPRRPFPLAPTSRSHCLRL